MSLSRRGFLGAAALLGLGGVARADGGDALRDWKRRRIDAAEAKFGGPVAVDGAGFLDRPAFALDDCRRLPQTPYCPQAGDILFSVSRFLILRLGHVISGAGQPNHSAYVFRRPDGCLAVMEAGPFDVPLIESRNLVGHLAAYHGRGHVWVRPRCVPLTPEQDCRLTAFSMKQEGKPFARLRLLAQVTPFRARGKLKSEIIGGPHGPDRRAYFCAELAAEAFVSAGLVPPADARPAATYPSDLFFDHSRVPYLDRHCTLARFGWDTPARWRPQEL